MPHRVFISADHGLAIIYFLQSDVVDSLLRSGIEVVVLTDTIAKFHLEDRFGQPGLVFESLRLSEAKAYWRNKQPSLQYWIDFLRRAGAANKINLEAVDGYVSQVKGEASPRRRALFPLVNYLVVALRNSRLARRALVRLQSKFTPKIYNDLFAKYEPSLVIASTPGWRLDRYLLREAKEQGVPSVSVIVGWDNTSSYSLPGAAVDWITCWSDIQKQELIDGSDWAPERVNVGGIPSYDKYFKKEWVLPRHEYFRRHGLDPTKKLISYASSFISFSPNIQNVEALVRVITSDQLEKPSQLLIRLHPNHFLDVPRFVQEREAIRALVQKHPDVHLVEPVALGGEIGHYSGEDMPEKSSMMAYSDIMVTVYSTMIVEASIHGTPVVSLCIDSEQGWPTNFTLNLSEIGGWPTHSRFRDSGAGQEVWNESELCAALNRHLKNPEVDAQTRQEFIARECTYTDGSAGKKTASFLLSLLEGKSV